MRPNINEFVYRPRQVVLAKKRSKKKTPLFVFLSFAQCKALAMMIVTASVTGQGITQFLHVKMLELQAKVDHLQARNTTIAEEHNRLLSAECQLASKTQIVALAKRKLKLFKPDKEQVHRL